MCMVAARSRDARTARATHTSGRDAHTLAAPAGWQARCTCLHACTLPAPPPTSTPPPPPSTPSWLSCRSTSGHLDEEPRGNGRGHVGARATEAVHVVCCVCGRLIRVRSLQSQPAHLPPHLPPPPPPPPPARCPRRLAAPRSAAPAPATASSPRHLRQLSACGGATQVTQARVENLFSAYGGATQVTQARVAGDRADVCREQVVD